MPEKIEPQLDELRRRARRRLVGAVVLALAAAVLVPMLLESDPKPLGEDVSVKIPPVDEGKFVSKLGDKGRSTDVPPAAIRPAPAKPAESPPIASPKDVAPPTKAPNAETAASAPQPAPPKPSVVPPIASPPAKEAAQGDASPPPVAPAPPAAKPAATPSASPAGATPPSPAPDSAKAAKPTSGAFSVQLAAFADDKGANALVNRLKKAGHPAYTEQYTSTRGVVWRVRVGPYGTREAAEGARTRLKADGQDGIIATSN